MPRLPASVLFLAFVLVLDVGTYLCGALGPPAAVVAATALVILAALLLRESLGRPAAPLREELLQRFGWLLLLDGWISAGAALWATQRRLGTEQALVLGAAVLGTVVLRRARPAALLAMTVLCGSALRVLSYAHLPIDPADGDMLPLVQAALRRFLAGQDPYTLYHFPWPLPLVYLPVCWLAYLPAHVLSVDLRVVNLAIELLLFGVLWRLSRGKGAVCLLWAWVFAGPSALLWSLHVTHGPFWLCAAVTLALAVSGRHLLAAVALGLSLGASPLGALLSPLIGLRWLRACSLGRAAAYGAVSLSLMALLLGPFWLWDPAGFLLGAVRWHNENSRLLSELQKLLGTGVQVGFAGQFFRFGVIGLMKPIQVGLLLGVYALYALRGAGARQLPYAAAAAYLLFMVFNPMVRGHYYWIVGVALLVGLAHDAPRSAPSTHPSHG